VFTAAGMIVAMVSIVWYAEQVFTMRWRSITTNIIASDHAYWLIDVTISINDEDDFYWK
jgi:hypothetical protein